MKTIAITIDEERLALIDQLSRSSAELRSRSALVRVAIRRYASHVQNQLEEERERDIVRRNKELLDEQLQGLIEDRSGN